MTGGSSGVGDGRSPRWWLSSLPPVPPLNLARFHELPGEDWKPVRSRSMSTICQPHAAWSGRTVAPRGPRQSPSPSICTRVTHRPPTFRSGPQITPRVRPRWIQPRLKPHRCDERRLNRMALGLPVDDRGGIGVRSSRGLEPRSVGTCSPKTKCGSSAWSSACNHRGGARNIRERRSLSCATGSRCRAFREDRACADGSDTRGYAVIA